MTTDATPTDTTTPETAGGYTPPLDASEAEAIDATRQWVETHIIADNLCPFAAREMARNSIQYAVVPGAGLERSLQALGDELLNLDANRDAETTLVIFKDGFRDFVIAHEAPRGLPGLINAIGIESPGLTASPAIARRVAEMSRQILG